MIILSEYKPKALPFIPKNQWMPSSQAIPKDFFGNDIIRTKFRIRAKTHDGIVVWSGWFDCRDDADAVLWSIATGQINKERELWRLPKPEWPGLDTDLLYDFYTITYLTGSPGSNSEFPRPNDWNDSDNYIEAIGGGGAGGSTGAGTGGGGGAGAKYGKAINLSPSNWPVIYQIGAGGNSTYGSGGFTWWNNETFPTVESNCMGVAPGGGENDPPPPGGSVPDPTANYGTSVNYTGGSGYTGVSGAGGGGGGAGGPNGDGDSATSYIGGDGDNGSGGQGGQTYGANGSNGLEWESTYGSGGGGAGGSNGATGDGGNGGNYGAGGGGAGDDNALDFGLGSQGIIVVAHTPSQMILLNMPMLGM